MLFASSYLIKKVLFIFKKINKAVNVVTNIYLEGLSLTKFDFFFVTTNILLDGNIFTLFK